MASHKTPDDDAYEQGVHDGQQADLLDQTVHSATKGFSLPDQKRQNEIYNKGYDYGVAHRPQPRHESSTANAPQVDTSTSETGCGQVIAVLIGIGIVVAVAIWLLANVVLPIALLNSAAILTICALAVRTRRVVFASLAFVGAGYMLLDISSGWFSANFVTRVVHSSSWLTAFVYINAAAAGLSAWVLLEPAHRRAVSDRRVTASFAVIAAIMIPMVVLPLIYHSLPPRTVTNAIAQEASAAPGPRTSNATLPPPGATFPLQLSGSGTFRGAWFEVWYPPGFAVVPSLKSATSIEGHDSAFFRAPDGQVEFYIYSPQWSGEPTDILIDEQTEKHAGSETSTSKANVVTWFTIRAADGSYTRTYQDTRSHDGSIRWIVGVKYANQRAYEKHKDDYKRFKQSLRQFAD